MAAKRLARRPRPDDSVELGHNGGNEGSDEEEKESGKSGETAMSAEPKEMPLKRSEKPWPPSTKDAGARGSGEASPARSAPRGGVALKIKTTSKHVKKPTPASQEEDEAGDSGDASPARDPLPDAAAGGYNKRAVTPKRGPPPRQGEERDGETLAASALQQLRKALTKPTSPPSSPDIAREGEHRGREMEEQEQSNTSPPQDEHRAREEKQQEKMITEQDHARDTSPPHDKDSAHGEEQQEEAANQEHVDDISPPEDNHSAPSTKPHSSETEKKSTVERSWSYDDELKILNALVVHAQSHNGALPDSSHLLANLTFDKTDATEDKLTDKIRKLRRRYCKFLLQGCPSDDFSRRLFKLSEILWGQVDEEEHQGEGIRQQEIDHEDEETGAPVNSNVFHGRNAPSTKPRSSETEKKPTVERSWSYDDELKILNALVVHAQSHNGALPDSSNLLANLTFDKIDVTEDKLTDKIRKLRRRYCKFLLQGCPSDDFSRRLFKLSEILWGQVDEDERVEPTSRDFSVLSKLYPHLAKEVKAYAETHSSGDLIMAMFTAIGDEKARDLDAKCKKQHIEAFKLELGQASLTNELLSALSSQITDPSQATPCKRRADKLKEPLDEQYLRRSKRVAGNTEGFKDKPNADVVFNPKPISMVPFPNTSAPPPHQGHYGGYCHWLHADSS